MRKLGVYNSYSGVTTNQAEGFNTMLKQYQHWKEAPVDAIILGLYYLQVFYYNEMQRGLSGLGTFCLRSKFTSLLRPADEVVSLKSYSPEEIVQRIRNQISNEFSKGAEESSSEEDISKSDVETKFANGTTKYSRARYVAITKCNCISVACFVWLQISVRHNFCKFR